MNFGLRLDEILHINGVKDYGVTVLKLIDVNEAKQAITSLTRELVVEAKPESRELGADEFQLTNSMNNGYNNALSEYHQNMLKALEEVE